MTATATQTDTTPASWTDLNRQWLLDAIDRLRARLDADGDPAAVTDCVEPFIPADFTPALVRCANTFGLSRFEREVLLLCTGLELDAKLRVAMAKLNPAAAGRATFGVALSILHGPHWDALSPDAPLRRWQMLRLESGPALADAALSIDERIVHHVAGVAATDPYLAPYVRRIDVEPRTGGDGDATILQRVADCLRETDDPPMVVLYGGGDAPTRHATAVDAVARSGAHHALWVSAGELPADPESLAGLALRFDREAALAGAPIILAVEDSAESHRAQGFANRLHVPLLWLGESNPSGQPPARRVVRCELPRRDAASTRLDLLRQADAAGVAAHPTVRAELERAAAQFHLAPTSVASVVEELRATPALARAAVVWPAARAASRGLPGPLAQRIDTRANLDDVVLPAGQAALLRDMARQLRHRERVYDEWGFGAKHDLGRGFVALFAGESGTGKTLAAEAVANEVGLDLYRIDLATVVSKYIGETEKNLKHIFDAAEGSGAVLLFDEADAIFGKRGEVKDSHDRYANIEIAYLLQRVEAYRGLAILTTNMKSALDRAFMRRIRFVISFPFPDAAAREQIWQRQFPPRAPLADIDFKSLATLTLAGGNIRSIALNAAFKAADAGVPISQDLLAAAAREEFAKLDRTMSELRGTGR